MGGSTPLSMQRPLSRRSCWQAPWTLVLYKKGANYSQRPTRQAYPCQLKATTKECSFGAPCLPGNIVEIFGPGANHMHGKPAYKTTREASIPHYEIASMEEPSVIDPPPPEEEVDDTLHGLFRWIVWKKPPHGFRVILPAAEQSITNPPEGWDGPQSSPIVQFSVRISSLRASKPNGSLRGIRPTPRLMISSRRIYTKVHWLLFEKWRSNFLPSAIFCSVGIQCLESFGHEALNIGMRWTWITEFRRRLDRLRTADNPLDWLPMDKGLLFSHALVLIVIQKYVSPAQPQPAQNELGIAEEFAARVCQRHPEFYANFLRSLFVEEDLARNAELPCGRSRRRSDSLSPYSQLFECKPIAISDCFQCHRTLFNDREIQCHCGDVLREHENTMERLTANGWIQLHCAQAESIRPRPQRSVKQCRAAMRGVQHVGLDRIGALVLIRR